MDTYCYPVACALWDSGVFSRRTNFWLKNIRKMKQVTLFLVLLAFSLVGNAQPFQIQKMKDFSKISFKDWQPDTSVFCGGSSTYLRKGDDKVQILIDERIKQIMFSSVVHPYGYVYQYDVHSNKLIKSTTFFYDMLVGKTYHYGANGKITKEEDWDAPYKISIDELKTICKQKFHLDLMDVSLKLDVRRANHQKPVYVICIPAPYRRGPEGKYITLSADNGTVLFEKEIHSKAEFKACLNEIYGISEE